MSQSKVFSLPMVNPNASFTKDVLLSQKFLTQQQLIQGAVLHPASMEQALKLVLDSAETEDSFFVADIRDFFNQFDTWVKHIPRVKPFFAVKSNPDPVLISILASLGTGFDCASKSEIKQILDLGISPDRIIYAHPCKPSSHLSYAYSKNVDLMTFDNSDELYKMKKLAPNARAVLRVSTDDSNSLCRLSLKFGAPMDTTHDLLTTAKKLGVNVVGVSFHVGSGCHDDSAFIDALSRARTVFDQAEDLGFNLSLLDIGGGFPSPKEKQGAKFSNIAANINSTLDKLFPPSLGINIISEPGRFFCSSAYSLAVNITSKRTVSSAPQTLTEVKNDIKNSEEPSFMYYINEGVYGSFNCIMFDHQIVYPEILVNDGEFVYDNPCEQSQIEKRFESSIWGPTCDSIDCVVANTKIPELFVGDWLLFQNLGAYSRSAASKFNGFESSTVFYYDSQQTKKC
ncbi:hypothetical protein BB561_002385 [Smittium simulii]|uniref:ornithine decarboxylase n=1 Tax=Smittium simulii TaxID=133385 RepID=A0A2T9YQN4_9FUNG|nr:hypothetical protein BB561_002385 [Smittium simulii]